MRSGRASSLRTNRTKTEAPAVLTRVEPPIRRAKGHGERTGGVTFLVETIEAATYRSCARSGAAAGSWHLSASAVLFFTVFSPPNARNPLEQINKLSFAASTPSAKSKKNTTPMLLMMAAAGHTPVLPPPPQTRPTTGGEPFYGPEPFIDMNQGTGWTVPEYVNPWEAPILHNYAR